MKKKATLLDGTTVEYIETDDPPSGAMKKTYFSPDKSYVVQFFIDLSSGDTQRMARLEAIIGKYNPTISEFEGGSAGTTQASAEYFRKLFCWPTGIVVKPSLGIVAPTYPGNYFFSDGPWINQEKQGRWFTSPKLRKMLPDKTRGTWLHYFSLCILMARAVRRLHQAGLAHSDLSSKNILIDPSSGQCTIIDIDSLVVPQVFSPDVLGTPGYIAPEVVGTQHLPLNDATRKVPSIQTDLHALSVLIYEYLLLRHPLRGPKVNSTVSAEEDERLSMGLKALFIENQQDKSNQPVDLKVAYSSLGPIIGAKMEMAFVSGLHSPSDRPSAGEWERALIRSWDLLYPCANSSCQQKWFILHDTNNVQCPFCGTKPKGPIISLKLRKQARDGIWMNDGHLILYHGQYLYKWHSYDNVFPGEVADRTSQAYCIFHEGKWLLVNQNLASLTSPDGNRVNAGQAIELKDGARIVLSQEQHGRIAEVQYIRC